jgi:hypothetical protein
MKVALLIMVQTCAASTGAQQLYLVQCCFVYALWMLAACRSGRGVKIRIMRLTLAKTSRRKVRGFILDLYLRISALGLSFLILFVELPCEDLVLDCVSSSEVEDQPCSRLEGPLLLVGLALAAAARAASSRLAAKMLL